MNEGGAMRMWAWCEDDDCGLLGSCLMSLKYEYVMPHECLSSTSFQNN